MLATPSGPLLLLLLLPKRRRIASRARSSMQASAMRARLQLLIRALEELRQSRSSYRFFCVTQTHGAFFTNTLHPRGLLEISLLVKRQKPLSPLYFSRARVRLLACWCAVYIRIVVVYSTELGTSARFQKYETGERARCACVECETKSNWNEKAWKRRARGVRWGASVRVYSSYFSARGGLNWKTTTSIKKKKKIQEG